MKLTAIALASAFVLSTTFAFAGSSHHHKYRSSAKAYSAGQSMNQGRYRASYGQYYGSPNNRGGLVGGSDTGVGGYGQSYGSQNNQGGWGGGWNTGGGYSQYYGSPNNRGGLVGGSDAGTYRP